MSNFGQDFLKGFGKGLKNFSAEFAEGFTEIDTLRDYTHASKTFTPNQYELKPRFKFLFHVSFTINTEIQSLNQFVSTGANSNLSYVVKTVDLPKYTVNTATLNQYNRKRVVQTGIEYQPITLAFHDDGGDITRNLWYNYFSYYYKDPSQKYLDTANNTNGSLGASANDQTAFPYNARDIYNDAREVNDWGYIGESITDGKNPIGDTTGKPPFFRDIRIYGMDQHKFAEYVLINPIITNWNHDSYNYSEGGGTMQNTMTIAYETVKYYAGAIGGARPDTNVKGFADPAHYDTTTSPLSRAGSRRTVFGQGGLLDAGGGILDDLQSGGPLGLLGAAQKALTAKNTFKGVDLRSLTKSEGAAIGTDVLVGGVTAAARSGRFFPTPKSPPTN
jgi:hypothetical protein